MVCQPADFASRLLLVGPWSPACHLQQTLAQLDMLAEFVIGIKGSQREVEQFPGLSTRDVTSPLPQLQLIMNMLQGVFIILD